MMCTAKPRLCHAGKMALGGRSLLSTSPKGIERRCYRNSELPTQPIKGLVVQVIILISCLTGWIFVAVWQVRHMLGVLRVGALDARYLWYGVAAVPIWSVVTFFLI